MKNILLMMALALAFGAGCKGKYDTQRVAPGVTKVRPGASTKTVTVTDPGRIFVVQGGKGQEVPRSNPGPFKLDLGRLDNKSGCSFFIATLPDPEPGPPEPPPKPFPGCPEGLKGEQCESLCMKCLPCCPRPPEKPVCR